MSSRDKGREALNGGTNGGKEVGGKADAAGEWRSRDGGGRMLTQSQKVTDAWGGEREQGWWGWGQGLLAWERCEVVSKPPELPPVPV